MKKFVVFILSFCLLNLDVFSLNKGSILIEYSSGEVLMDENAYTHNPPASMTKMMTLLLVMEKIDTGKIKLTDKVTISDNASKMGGSQVFLQPGEVMTVDELIKSVCIASANDVAVTKKQSQVIGEEITI